MTMASFYSCNKDKTVSATDITIAPAEAVSVVVGSTTTLTATVVPANATNKKVTWSSDNTSIATINDQTGVVTGISVGTATVHATAADGSGVTATKSVSVAPITVTGISIAPAADVSVSVGNTTTLTATVAPSNATNKNITWSSLNTACAAVNASTGVVTGVSAGTVTVRATAADGSGVTADKNVTVTEAIVPVTGITITPAADVSVLMGSTTTLTATIAPSNATNQNVIWSSLNTACAAVDVSTGVVTGVSAGTVTVRATAADGSGVTADKSVMVISIFESGDGTSDNPYTVATPAQLDAVRSNLSAHYRQIANISLNGTWMRIGTNTSRFTGSYDGRGYSITDLSIPSATTDYQGMFGYIGEGGIVRNVALRDVNVKSTGNYVGGIAGCNYGTIENCYVSGSVSGSQNIGGVAGQNSVQNSGEIRNCYTTCNVTSTKTPILLNNIIAGAGGIA